MSLFLDITEPSRLQALLRFMRVYWPILLPLVLGGVGIYWLLPQARRSKPLWAALLASLALIAAGWWLIHSETVWVETLLFYAFAGSALVGGGLLITMSNPVHGALSFALVVLSTCGLYLLQGAPFLMAATIIIYAGAIIVTFLFVIMLAQQAGPSDADQRTREPFLATLAGFILLGALLVVLQKTYDTSKLDQFLDKVRQASQGTTLSEIEQVLGDPKEFSDWAGEVPFTTRNRQVEERIAFANAINKGREEWNGKNVPGFVAALKKIQEAGARVRARQGSLQPDADVPLSAFSGTPANKEGKGLPAANVAGLGRALFTDHLLALELAGTLLLVATIGAIAIVARRPEDLR